MRPNSVFYVWSRHFLALPVIPQATDPAILLPGSRKCASDHFPNFVSTVVLVDLEDELTEHWTLLDDERKLVSALHGEARR